jgi:hypothetical protein
MFLLNTKQLPNLPVGAKVDAIAPDCDILFLFQDLVSESEFGPAWLAKFFEGARR